MVPVRYELGFYISKYGSLHSHHRETLKSYIALTGWVLCLGRNVSPVRYELSCYISEDGILHSPAVKTSNLILGLVIFHDDAGT
jgi:hypothetical protein